MARALAVPFVQDAQGNVVAGVQVDVVDPVTLQQIPDTVYSDPTANTIVTLPITTDASGHGPALWLTAGKICKQKVTINGVDYYDWLPFVDPTATGTGGGSGGVPAAHTHSEGDVTGLPTDLASKAPTTHTHTEGQVTNLTADLNGKASASHSHLEADVANLTGDLAGKASSVHTHAAADVVSGTVATARLGSGAASATTFLRGDQTWATPAGGGGGSGAWQLASGFISPFATEESPEIYISAVTSLTAFRVNRIGGTGGTMDILRNGVSLLSAPVTTTGAAFVAGTLLANPTTLAVGDVVKITCPTAAGGPDKMSYSAEGTR
jgi:hypothetical protein